MSQELIAELNSFEVDFTSAGNMRVDVRSKDHHGDLVIATPLALWSAVGRPSGRIDVVRGWLDAEQLAKRQKEDGPAKWWEIRRPERERAPEIEARELHRLHPFLVGWYRFARALTQACLDIKFACSWLLLGTMWLAVVIWIVALACNVVSGGKWRP
jgi:hypothetical protein